MNNFTVAGLALASLLALADFSFFALDRVAEFTTCLALGLICLLPFAYWLCAGLNGVPVFATLCLNHFVWYALPHLTAHTRLSAYSETTRVLTALAVVTFLAAAYTGGVLAGNIAHLLRAGRSTLVHYLDREIELRQTALMLVCYGIWLATDALLVLGLFPNVGTGLSTIRSVTLGIGAVGLFGWAYGVGLSRREGKPKSTIPLVLLCSTHVALSATTGFLVGAVFIAVAAVVPYSLGRKRIPMLVLATGLLAISFLQLGKSEMRAQFWGSSGFLQGGSASPITILTTWTSFSWNALSMLGSEDFEESRSVSHRASLAHMVSLVLAETGESVAPLSGATYAFVPTLFIPRFLWPEKPRGSAPNELLGIHYGVADEVSVEYTSITFGLIAEAYANFSWIGIAGLGLVAGILARFSELLATGRPPNSVGFILAGLILLRSWDIGNLLATTLLSLAQTLPLATLLLLYISKPPTHRVTTPYGLN